MQPIHEDIARTDAVHRRWQLRRKMFPVDVDDERGFAGAIKALADADGEECGVLLHQLVSDLTLNRHGGCDRGGAERGSTSCGGRGGRCTECDRAGCGGNYDGAHTFDGCRNNRSEILIDIHDQRCCAGLIAALSGCNAKDAGRRVDKCAASR